MSSEFDGSTITQVSENFSYSQSGGSAVVSYSQTYCSNSNNNNNS